MGATGKGTASPQTITGNPTTPPVVGTIPTQTIQPSTPLAPITPANQNNPQVVNQTPNSSNTPVNTQALQNLQGMSDDELASLVTASKSALMPNFLSDRKDATQQFVFQAGLNGKPMVLDSAQFAQFMSDNGIPQREVMGRSVGGANYTNPDGTNVRLTPQQVIDIMTDSRLNYIGGKVGGQSYGAGTYFDMNGGVNTGYASGATAVAVLNPKTAKVVSDSALPGLAATWAKSHPKTARAIGRFSTSTQSIYALCMGYNVITAGRRNDTHNVGNYYNVIDRTALVYRR